jgi:acyl dehydratase
VAKSRVTALHDRGPERGALAALEREIRNAATGRLLARAKRIEVLRGDGGFSARDGVSDPAPERLPKLDVGERKPDLEIELASLPQAALIYRLSGDYNPLHADPAVARRAGFPRPILHGLATFGMAAHAVLRGVCDYAPSRLQRLAARFTAPVFPGETLRFEIWIERDERVRFRAHARARAVIVLDCGTAELRSL